MLMPHELSPKSQKKYFDKIIENDFNPMAREGLRDGDGRPVVVKIFGQVNFVMPSRCDHIAHPSSICSDTTTLTDAGLEREGKIPRPSLSEFLHGMFALSSSLS